MSAANSAADKARRGKRSRFMDSPRFGTSSLGKILADQRQELARAVGLGEVARGPGLRRLFAITAERERRDDDDRNVTRARVRLEHPGGVEARHLRELHVHQDEIRRLLLRHRYAGLAVHRLDEALRGAAAELPHDLAIRCVVLDVEDGLVAHVTSSFRGSGTAKKNVLPLPVSLSTHTRPPCISTNFLVMLKPRPVPPNSRVTVVSTWRNSAKTLSSSSFGIPMPVSETLNTSSSPRSSAPISTRPFLVNLIAFAARFITHCARRRLPPDATGRP